MKGQRFWIMVAGVAPRVDFVGFVLLAGPGVMVLPQLLPPELLFVPFLAIFLVLATAFQYTARLELGEEGFSLSWCGRFEKFVPYSEIARVSKEFRWTQPNNRVIVGCRSRPTVYIPVWSAGAAEKVEAALREAVNVSRRPLPRPVPVKQQPDLVVLQRGDRSTREWIAHLRRVGDGATPRLASPPREALWALVQHPDVAPRVRIAATIALTGASATEADRVRIAELAGSLPESPVARAMDLALHDDSALSEALAEFVDISQEVSRD